MTFERDDAIVKRPLLVIGLSFAGATWFAFLFDVTGALTLSGFLAAAGILFMLFGHGRLRLICAVVLSCAIALGSYSLYYLRTVTPFAHLQGDTLLIQGVLVEGTFYSGHTSLTVVADFPENPQLPQKQRVLLQASGVMDFQVGDVVVCTVKVNLPQNTPKAQYYRSKGIVLLGSLQAESMLPGPEEPYRPWQLWEELREKMQSNLRSHLTPSIAEVVGVMAVGLPGDLDPDTYTAVNKSGTVHLLSISGLHMSILTAFLLGGFAKLRMPPLPRYLLTLLLALGFAVLTGLSASIVRSYCMIAVMLIARLFHQNNDSPNTLGLSLLLICLIWPNWTQGRGLWLSVSSTLGILVCAHSLEHSLGAVLGWAAFPKLKKILTGSLAVSVSAYIFSMPILLLTNGWFSLVSPVANLLVLPFITPAILGGILCAMLGINNGIIRLVALITELSVRCILAVSKGIASLPFAIVSMDQGYLLILFVFLLIGAGIVVYCKAHKALVGYGLTLCVLCYCVGTLSLQFANRDKVELVTLEQCDTAFLLRNKQAVLLGAPSKYTINKVMNYLNYRGISHISGVIDPAYGDQVDSGLLRLSASRGFDCMIAPDDAYILDLLESALPSSISVLSAGYAQVLVLDSVEISFDRQGQSMKLDIGDNTVLKTVAEYGIMEGTVEDICIYKDGYLQISPKISPQVEPVGRYLFGESRILLSIQSTS